MRLAFGVALRPRARIRPRGVLEYWSIGASAFGVMRYVGIAPRDRRVGVPKGQQER